jgi:hypothetical protein
LSPLAHEPVYATFDTIGARNARTKGRTHHGECRHVRQSQRTSGKSLERHSRLRRVAAVASRDRAQRGDPRRHKDAQEADAHGGGEIVEELEQHSDGSRSYSYRILHSPLPVAGYRSELSVRDEGAGHCKVRWSSTFKPSRGSEADAAAAIRGVYQAGFDSLKKMFGG